MRVHNVRDVSRACHVHEGLNECFIRDGILGRFFPDVCDIHDVHDSLEEYDVRYDVVGSVFEFFSPLASSTLIYFYQLLFYLSNTVSEFILSFAVLRPKEVVGSRAVPDPGHRWQVHLAL
jgi:hypothetical protein